MPAFMENLENTFNVKPMKRTKTRDIAQDYYNAGELAETIEYLNNPENEKKKDFEQKKACLYAYAFLQRNKELSQWLEARFSERTVADKTIVINISKDED